MQSPFSSSSPLSTPGSSFGAPRPAPLAGVLGLWPVLPAALLIGIAYHFIGQFLDLLILFPLLAGGCVGGVIAARAKKHKLRSKPLLITLAVVAGLTCFGARWLSDAVQTREELIASRTAKWKTLRPGMSPQVIERGLRRYYSPARFLKLYIAVLDKDGTTIGDVGASSSSASNSAVTGTAFWMLTLFDALLICGAAAAVSAGQANQPFCETCDKWHGVALTVSRLHPNQAGEAARLAGESKFADLGGLRNQGATQKSYCDVLLTKCPGCATGQLSVKRALNNQAKTLWKGAVSPPQVKELETVRAQWLQ